MTIRNRDDFFTGVLNGRVHPDTADEILDDYIDLWHAGDGKPGESLAEYLGFTREEYADWMQNPVALIAILRHKVATSP